MVEYNTQLYTNFIKNVFVGGIFMYKFEKKGNSLVVTVSGFFTPEEAQAYIADYEKTLKTLKPEETNLILDGKELKASTQEMLPLLEACMNMYVRDKFKKIYMVKFASAVTNSQVARLGKATGLMNNVVMVESVEDALAQCK